MPVRGFLRDYRADVLLPNANKSIARVSGDTALVDRFIAAIETLTRRSDDRICLAVSGGTDSMAMLLLAAQAMPDRIVAATVNHRLRDEAAAEAAFVAEHCTRLRILHQTLSPESPITGNIQSRARAVRYDLLQHYAAAQNCAVVATAHHRDDQLETFVMRLSRGSGVDGLSAVRARNGNIIRPMLQFSRAELEAACAAYGVTPVQDPSNADPDYDRVRIRQWLSKNELPFDAAAVSRSCTALTDAGDALAWMTDMLASERIMDNAGTVSIDIQGLPRELRRRLLLRALGRLPAIPIPRGSALTAAIAKLERGEKTMLGDALIHPGEKWAVAKAPSRRSQIDINTDDDIDINDAKD